MQETDAAIDAWGAVIAAVIDDLPESTFQLWVEPLELAGEADNALCVHGPYKVAAWSRRRYGDLLGRLTREFSDFRGIYIAEKPDHDNDPDHCL